MQPRRSEAFSGRHAAQCVALVLATSLNIDEVFTPNIKRYWDRINERPAFKKAYDL